MPAASRPSQTVKELSDAFMVTVPPTLTSPGRSGWWAKDEYYLYVYNGDGRAAHSWLQIVASAAAADLSNADAQAAVGLRIPRPLPLTGQLIALGDSQTAGYNNATKPYTSGGFLVSGFRWPTMLADALGLTLSNHGVGGSRISWKDANTDGESRVSIFNKCGREVQSTTTGVIAIMAGWNNLGQAGGVYDAAYFARLRNGYEAIIARALLDDWGGITHLGWTRTAQVDNPTGWSKTNCTSGQPAADTNAYVPFSWNNGTRDRRYWTIIGATTGVLEFQISNQRAVALFFDTQAGGGSVAIKVNGSLITTYDSAFSAPLGDKFPGVVFMDNLPSGTVTVRMENTSAGTVLFLAYGTISRTFNQGSRHVLFSGPCGNDGGTNARPLAQRQAAFVAARQAVAAFAPGYPVSFVDAQSQWVESRDQEPTDTSHLTDLGNFALAQQFFRPITLPNEASPNVLRL